MLTSECCRCPYFPGFYLYELRPQINTLDVPGLGHTPVDFADGVAIAHALHQMYPPDLFTWLGLLCFLIHEPVCN